MSTSGTLQLFDDHDDARLVAYGRELLRHAAAGAMIGGGWTAYSSMAKVRGHERSLEEAVRNTVRNAAIGAGAGAVWGAAAHVAQTHPLAGVAAVVTVGAGALYLAERSRKLEPAASTTPEPAPEAKAEASPPAPARRPQKRAAVAR